MPHIHEKYDFTVSCFIVHEAKVLLVNHPRYSKWLAPGGHVELDENPNEALVREIEEETGLDVEILSKQPEGDYPGTELLMVPEYMGVHEANPPHRHIDLVYFARAINNAHRQSDEHDEVRWFSSDELDDPSCNIPDIVKFYARAAIKRVGEVS
jgi:8-oxo-dGTP pyrophosphatase MutT (NUDIX family)